MTADKKLKAYIDRVLRLKEEQDTLGDDIREVYAEAKGEGYDKTVMGKLVAHLRKVAKSGADAVDEAESIFETYLSAYHRASGTVVATHTHEDDYDRETGEVFGDNVSAKLVATVATGLQTETGRKALVTALDIMIEREEAEERRSDGGLNILTKHEDIRTAPETAEEAEPEAAAEVAGNDLREPVAAEQGQIIREGDAPRETDRFGGDASCLDTEFQMDRATEGSFETGSEAAEKGRKATATIAAPADLNHAGAGESPATHSEKATVASQGEATAPTSDERVSLPVNDRSDAAANAGGDHEEVADSRAAKGEGAPSAALPAAGVTMEYVPASGVKRLPFAHCFPELSKADYERLEKDIAANRVQTPIIREGDVIVDGWARYLISRQYGMSYPIQEYSGTDVLLDVIELQRAARNFTPAQEKKIAANLAKEFPHRADEIMAAFGLAEALEAAE
ncbi:MAG: DUF2312 domain-containing protein [Shinella sp.]|nr:GapR family DNA-binding domain-containing protein [Shinella sp.]MDX3973265.1 DUF2312 domain-containing protein [Shinella sp.]